MAEVQPPMISDDTFSFNRPILLILVINLYLVSCYIFLSEAWILHFRNEPRTNTDPLALELEELQVRKNILSRDRMGET